MNTTLNNKNPFNYKSELSHIYRYNLQNIYIHIKCYTYIGASYDIISTIINSYAEDDIIIMQNY